MFTLKRVKRISSTITEYLLCDDARSSIISDTLTQNNLSLSIWDRVLEEVGHISNNPRILNNDHIEMFCDYCFLAFVNVFKREHLLID